MPKKPFVKFFYNDYLVDMQMVSAEAERLWMRLLCRIWNSDITGVITVDITSVSRLLGENLQVAQKLFDELRQNDVFDCEDIGPGKWKITSRRVVRDAKQSTTKSNAGKEGMKKRYGKTKETAQPVITGVTARVITPSITNDISSVITDDITGVITYNNSNSNSNYNHKDEDSKDRGVGKGKEGEDNAAMRQCDNEQEADEEYYPDFGTPGQPVGLVSITQCLADYLTPRYSATRDVLAMNHRLPVETIGEWAAVFARKLQSEGETTKTMSDFISHFSRWLNKQNNKQEPQKYFGNGTDQRTGNRNQNYAANERARPSSAAVLKRPGGGS